jgi:hypothetical protein
MNRRDFIFQEKSSKVQFVRNMTTTYDVNVLNTGNFSMHIQSFQLDDDTLHDYQEWDHTIINV